MFMRKGSRTRTGKVLVKRGHESEDLCYGWRVQLWLPGRSSCGCDRHVGQGHRTSEQG